MNARRWTAALVVAALLAFTAAACGDDGNDGGGDQAAASDSLPAGDSEQQVRDAVENFFRSLRERDAVRFCDSLTEEYQAEQSAVIRHNQPCKVIYKKLFTLREGVTYKEDRPIPKVTRVVVEGNLATATIGRGYGAYDLHLTPDDGTWKLIGRKAALQMSDAE